MRHVSAAQAQLLADKVGDALGLVLVELVAQRKSLGHGSWRIGVADRQRLRATVLQRNRHLQAARPRASAAPSPTSPRGSGGIAQLPARLAIRVPTHGLLARAPLPELGDPRPRLGRAAVEGRAARCHVAHQRRDIRQRRARTPL